MSGDLVYLDHAASTPMRREAIEAMLPFLDVQFANPSGSHRFARQARAALDSARDIVAGAVGCDAGDVVFTGGGTEADNTAVMGAVNRHGGLAVCSAAEHHAVLHAVERVGGAVVGVDAAGRIDQVELEQVLVRAAAGETPPVTVVSVMAVNNEVGSVTDIAAVSALVRRLAPGALVHTDGVQAPSWIDLREVTPHVDLLSLSGHKFGGPKGVGALVVRRPDAVAPLLVGGGQERERRSGTQNVAGAVALAEALRCTDLERGVEVPRLAALRDRLVDALRSGVPDLYETVSPELKVAGSAHVCIPDVENEALLFLLDEGGVCASAASACAAGAMEPSHVLSAMSVPVALARGALRLTLGHSTTVDDVDRAAAVISAAVDRIRRFTLRPPQPSGTQP
jgi:cysteine desulfurase